jgi:hypothetical protein
MGVYRAFTCTPVKNRNIGGSQIKHVVEAYEILKSHVNELLPKS